MLVDGVVVLAPYFYQLGQVDLIAYYRGLADQCRKPLYMYDLPQRTRTNLELETVLQLAEHANIRGIKCSGEHRICQLSSGGSAVVTTTTRLVLKLHAGRRTPPARCDSLVIAAA